MNGQSTGDNNGLKINVHDDINIAESVGGSTGIVATVTSVVNTVHLGFPMTSSSGFVIQTALESAGKKWTLDELTIHAEKYERARGIGKGGYKFKVGGSIKSAGAEIPMCQDCCRV